MFPGLKNNAAAGYQGPVKIELLKGAGLLSLLTVASFPGLIALIERAKPACVRIGADQLNGRHHVRPRANNEQLQARWNVAQKKVTLSDHRKKINNIVHRCYKRDSELRLRQRQKWPRDHVYPTFAARCF